MFNAGWKYRSVVIFNELLNGSTCIQAMLLKLFQVSIPYLILKSLKRQRHLIHFHRSTATILIRAT